MTSASSAYGEEISEGNYSFNHIDYIIEGETAACGIGIQAINKKMQYLDASINLNISEDGKRLSGLFKVTVSQVAFLDKQIAPKALYVNHGWIKTSTGTKFIHNSLMRGSDENHFMAVSNNIDNVMAVITEINMGNNKIGFNEEKGKYDKIYELKSPPTQSTQNKIFNCIDNLIAETLEKNSKPK